MSFVFNLFNNIKSYIKIIGGSVVGLVLMFFTYKYKSTQNENKNLKKEKDALKNTIEVEKKINKNELNIKDTSIAIKENEINEDNKIKRDIQEKVEEGKNNEKIIFEA